MSEEKGVRKNKYEVIIVAILSLVGCGVLYNDLIDVPKKNHEYARSCYWVSFTVFNPGENNRYKRELFFDCLGSNPDATDMYRCWKTNSPETADQSYTGEDCATNLYDDNKVIF